MEQWFAFRAHNSQTVYGWGTPTEAEAYADHLSKGREVNLYGAYEMTDTEAAEERLEDRTDAVNLDDELRALADEENGE